MDHTMDIRDRFDVDCDFVRTRRDEFRDKVLRLEHHQVDV
jgi:hypothetical protein